VAGLVFTASGALTTAHFMQLRDAEHFDRLQVQALRAIDRSFDGYTSILRGMAAEVAADGSPDTERLGRFLPAAGAPDAYPGLRSLGLIWWLGADAAPGSRALAKAALAADKAGDKAVAGPLGESAVLFNYPMRGGAPKNLGADLYAEAARRQAMASARAVDKPRLSEQLTTYISVPGAGEPHLLLFYPVNAEGPGGAEGPGQRRFLGWVCGIFHNKELFQSTLADFGYLSEISVRIYDGAVAPSRLLYDSQPGDQTGGLTDVRTHEVAGRRWVVQFATTRKFEGWPVTTTVLPIAAAGLAITLSLAFASWLQAAGLGRAQRAEAEAKAARDRSTLLMGEVNHRVANSLQLVSTLVSMQADQVCEPAARAALTETRNRIMAVGRVHQRLYSSGDVSRVALRPYLEGLAGGLSGGARPGVRLTLVAADVSAATDVAVSIGVVAAELVTNALKYAYPDGFGEIRLILSAEGGVGVLSVEDDGVGLPATQGAKEGQDGQASADGLGMRIVQAMTSSVKGELAVETRRPGHRVALMFPLR
jgi:two-component sensor histidine kinase/CHASE1-domain containing sensor protein